MNQNELNKIVEALLFATPDPLTQKKINSIFNPDTPNLKKTIDELNKLYIKQNHAFEIKNIAGGYQIVSKAEYEIYIRRMLNKSGKIILSKAAMDCLAIIAYKQPVGRYEIEAIRGVDSSGVIKTLLTKNLVIIKGRDVTPGRPLLYKTTNIFLEYFGINRISDLPKLKEITELIESDSNFGEQIAVFEDSSEDKNHTEKEKNDS
tara:strand:- start:64 stop:678 length:615 start_codon:yes stop_codon:yes gene_type:complete